MTSRAMYGGLFIVFMIALAVVLVRPSFKRQVILQGDVFKPHLPGIIQPSTINAGGCFLGQTTRTECPWIREALAGSPSAAAHLAAIADGKDQAEAIYWYTVAAENGDVASMEIIGRTFYDGMFTPDLKGSRARGEFWLDLARFHGSKKAQSIMNGEQTDVRVLSLTRVIENTNANSSEIMCTKRVESASQGVEIACAQIPFLVEAALRGEGDPATKIATFFSLVQSNIEKENGKTTSRIWEDAMYWRVIAAESGDAGAQTDAAGWMSWRSSDQPTEVDVSARGEFWLKKAAASSYRPAIRLLLSEHSDANVPE